MVDLSNGKILRRCPVVELGICSSSSLLTHDHFCATASYSLDILEAVLLVASVPFARSRLPMGKAPQWLAVGFSRLLLLPCT